MYFKDASNNLHFIEDAAYAYLLPSDCVEITDEEAMSIQEANKPIESSPKISPRQIRMALTQLGLRSQVETAVAAGDQDMKDWYEFSTYFDRNHPQVISMAAALGVDDQELDTLWELGDTL